MPPNEKRKKSAWCVSSNPDATATEVERLVQDVMTYRVANPEVTLEVSGAGSEAVAKKLKATVTKGTGAKAGTVVVAKKAGVVVAQFFSTTTIVPAVHTQSGGGSGGGSGQPIVDLSVFGTVITIFARDSILDMSGNDFIISTKEVDMARTCQATVGTAQYEAGSYEDQGFTSYYGVEWYGRRACAISVSSGEIFDTGNPDATSYARKQTRPEHKLLCYFTTGTSKEDWQLDAGGGRFIHYFGTDNPSEDMIQRETQTGKTGAYDLTWYAVM